MRNPELERAFEEIRKLGKGTIIYNSGSIKHNGMIINIKVEVRK